jgi:3-phenylpropionate/trans-cinnamate dioxygenase ferredoxin subunit
VTRVFLCRSGDVAPGTAKRFQPDGLPALALARCDDGLHAVIDECSHEDYPLSKGEVVPDLCEIECARHGSAFSLLDGEAQSLPATRPVRVFELEVDGDDVYVVVP